MPEQPSKLVLEGGQQRTVFRLSIQMQRLEAVFNYEASDAPPLGSISVQVLCMMLKPRSSADEKIALVLL